jgi:hypothetical protein
MPSDADWKLNAIEACLLRGGAVTPTVAGHVRSCRLSLSIFPLVGPPTGLPTPQSYFVLQSAGPERCTSWIQAVAKPAGSSLPNASRVGRVQDSFPCRDCASRLRRSAFDQKLFRNCGGCAQASRAAKRSVSPAGAGIGVCQNGWFGARWGWSSSWLGCEKGFRSLAAQL